MYSIKKIVCKRIYISMSSGYATKMNGYRLDVGLRISKKQNWFMILPKVRK